MVYDILLTASIDRGLVTSVHFAGSADRVDLLHLPLWFDASDLQGRRPTRRRSRLDERRDDRKWRLSRIVRRRRWRREGDEDDVAVSLRLRMSEEMPSSAHGHFYNVDFALLFHRLLNPLLRHQRVRRRLFGEVSSDRMCFDARMRRSREAAIDRNRDALKMEGNDDVDRTRPSHEERYKRQRQQIYTYTSCQNRT